eukprot:5963578-Pyramimonas_sp.AAC.1
MLGPQAGSTARDDPSDAAFDRLFGDDDSANDRGQSVCVGVSSFAFQGIFPERTNQPHEALVYSHNGPIGRNSALWNLEA